MKQIRHLDYPRKSTDPIVLIIEYLIEETQSKSPMASSLLRLARLAFIEDGMVKDSALEFADRARLKRRAS